jgi:hypothetical protein
MGLKGVYFTKEDLSNARRSAVDPTSKIDIRAACKGLLSQTIFKGAHILATGRNTEMINMEKLDKKARLYHIADMTEKDQKTLTEMMQKNPDERNRILKEIPRIDSFGNEHFLSTPLMTKNIITLIMNKRVNIESIKSSAEVYLMLCLMNLDWHTGILPHFLMLDPSYQEYIISCLK